MSKMKLVVIGNGMVGHRYLEDLVEKTDMANYDVTVFCEEPRVAYDRVHLSSYFSHHTADELSLVKEGFYEKHGINVLIGERAININRENKSFIPARVVKLNTTSLYSLQVPTHLFHLLKVTRVKTVLSTALLKTLKLLKQRRRKVNAALWLVAAYLA